MTEIKLDCPCGTRFAFDVEPVNGQMPSSVQCPSCQGDATAAANAILATRAPAPMRVTVASPPPPPAGTRLSSAPATEPSPGRPGPAGFLDRKSYLVKERVGLLKLADTYDILDPHSGQVIGIAREQPPMWVILLRLALGKHSLPTTVNLYEAEGQPAVLTISRGFTFLRSKVRVSARGQDLGYFRSKLLSLGGGFYVFDPRDQQVAEIKGDWKGWNFRFLDQGGREFGQVTKKWSGFGKEFFTSADNYMITIAEGSAVASALMLAAGLAIDIVFKEAE